MIAANIRFHDRMVESAWMPLMHQLMNIIRRPILVARLYVLSDSTASENASTPRCSTPSGRAMSRRRRNAWSST